MKIHISQGDYRRIDLLCGALNCMIIEVRRLQWPRHSRGPLFTWADKASTVVHKRRENILHLYCFLNKNATISIIQKYPFNSAGTLNYIIFSWRDSSKFNLEIFVVWRKIRGQRVVRAFGISSFENCWENR